MVNPYERFRGKYGIKGLERDSEEFFKGAINIALREYHVPKIKLADEFKVSESSIGRWARGNNLPVSGARSIIVDRLAKMLS